jgi:hypothetical protein
MAKPGPHGKDKQRCGARVRHRHGFCRKWPVPGKSRCKLHGGRSTGALTDEGKARSLAAMRAGRQRWLEEMRAKKAAGEIERFPGGRKAGARWVTQRMREERAIAEIRELRAESAHDSLRRRNRPLTDDLVMRAKARIAEIRAQLSEHPARPSPNLERLLRHVEDAERRLADVDLGSLTIGPVPISKSPTSPTQSP